MPSGKSKRDPDQKLNPARSIFSPKSKVMQSIVDQLLDQLHAEQNFVAELDTELEQEPDRSLEPAPQAYPKPRKTDVKRRAPVAIAKPTASITEKPAADPPLTLEEITKTARRDQVVQLYDLLKRLGDLPDANKGESALRVKFEDAFKQLWDVIDQSTTLTAKDRKLFFRQLTNAGEHERYQFIADMLGSTPDAVRGWRFPRKPKEQKHT